MPRKLEELKARVRELTPTLFNPDRCHPYKVLNGSAYPKGGLCAGYFDHQKAVEFFGGFIGPYMPPWMQPI